MFQSIVEAIFYHADRCPDKLCLADDRDRVTYREYACRITQYAAVLAGMGVTKGSCVVIESCQNIAYLCAAHALQLLGGVFVPVEHNCAAEKIGAFARLTDAAAVITRKQMDFEGCRCLTHDGLGEMAADAEPYRVESFPASGDVSEILFSTGTTGKEKGIVITHGNNLALAENVIYGVEMQGDNVEMIPSPMNHSHGLRRYYGNMYLGCTVVLLSSVMNAKRFFSNLSEFGVTAIDMVPTALTMLLQLSKNRLAEYRDQLRYIQLGAAPLMEADQNKLCELLPDTRLYNFYGSTESGCIAIYNFNRPDPKPRCIGKPAHNANIVIVDDEHNPIESSSDRAGLLSSRGGMNMLGYFNDPEETKKVLIDGVVYSNDIAYFDEDGDIILLGRKGDVINVGGNKVSPEEIENVCKMMPEVADCGVIPMEDSYKGHVPKLFVEMVPGAEFDPLVVRRFLAERLEPYKVPAYIEYIAKIPRSYNGKLLRKELKQL